MAASQSRSGAAASRGRDKEHDLALLRIMARGAQSRSISPIRRRERRSITGIADQNQGGGGAVGS
jgi:hypothetical protein